MKNFLLLLILLKTKPPIDFFAQNSVQFGRRAKRGDLQIVDFSLLAPRVGFEPTTNRLTGDRSTTELPRNIITI